MSTLTQQEMNELQKDLAVYRTHIESGFVTAIKNGIKSFSKKQFFLLPYKKSSIVAETPYLIAFKRVYNHLNKIDTVDDFIALLRNDDFLCANFYFEKTKHTIIQLNHYFFTTIFEKISNELEELKDKDTNKYLELFEAYVEYFNKLYALTLSFVVQAETESSVVLFSSSTAKLNRKVAKEFLTLIYKIHKCFQYYFKSYFYIANDCVVSVNEDNQSLLTKTMNLLLAKSNLLFFIINNEHTYIEKSKKDTKNSWEAIISAENSVYNRKVFTPIKRASEMGYPLWLHSIGLSGNISHSKLFDEPIYASLKDNSYAAYFLDKRFSNDYWDKNSELKLYYNLKEFLGYVSTKISDLQPLNCGETPVYNLVSPNFFSSLLIPHNTNNASVKSNRAIVAIKICVNQAGKRKAFNGENKLAQRLRDDFGCKIKFLDNIFGVYDERKTLGINGFEYYFKIVRNDISKLYAFNFFSPILHRFNTLYYTDLVEKPHEFVGVKEFIEEYPEVLKMFDMSPIKRSFESYIKNEFKKGFTLKDNLNASRERLFENKLPTPSAYFLAHPLPNSEEDINGLLSMLEKEDVDIIKNSLKHDRGVLNEEMSLNLLKDLDKSGINFFELVLNRQHDVASLAYQLPFSRTEAQKMRMNLGNVAFNTMLVGGQSKARYIELDYSSQKVAEVLGKHFTELTNGGKVIPFVERFWFALMYCIYNLSFPTKVCVSEKEKKEKDKTTVRWVEFKDKPKLKRLLVTDINNFGTDLITNVIIPSTIHYLENNPHSALNTLLKQSVIISDCAAKDEETRIFSSDSERAWYFVNRYLSAFLDASTPMMYHKEDNYLLFEDRYSMYPFLKTEMPKEHCQSET